jgi:hypothetical protein
LLQIEDVKSNDLVTLRAQRIETMVMIKVKGFFFHPCLLDLFWELNLAVFSTLVTTCTRLNPVLHKNQMFLHFSAWTTHIVGGANAGVAPPLCGIQHSRHA